MLDLSLGTFRVATQRSYIGVQGMPHLTDADRTLYDPNTGLYTQNNNGYWQNIQPYASSVSGVNSSYWIYMETNEFGEATAQPNKSRKDWVFTGPVLGDGTTLPMIQAQGVCYLNNEPQDGERCTLSDGTYIRFLPTGSYGGGHTSLQDWCADTTLNKFKYNTIDDYESNDGGVTWGNIGTTEAGVYSKSQHRSLSESGTTFCFVGGQVHYSGDITTPPGTDLETWCSSTDTKTLKDGTTTTDAGTYYVSCDSIGGRWTPGTGNYYGNGTSASWHNYPSAKWGVDTVGEGANITWSIIPSNTAFSAIGFAPSAGDDNTEDWASLPFSDYTSDMESVFTEIEAECGIAFSQVTWDANDEVHADLIIGFAPLDGKSSGVKAYAYLPSGGVEGSDDEYIDPLSGNIFMDSDSTTWWSPTSSTIDKPTGSFNWRAIFRHELLHGLGFKHNLDLDSAVYTNPQNYNEPETFLSIGDKAGLKYLYGTDVPVVAPVTSTGTMTITFDNPDTATYGPYSIWPSEFKFQVNGSWVTWATLTGAPTVSASFEHANYPASLALDGLINTAGWWHVTASAAYPITIAFNFDPASNDVITGFKYISATNTSYTDGSCDIGIEVDGVTKVSSVISPGTVGTNWENDFTW